MSELTYGPVHITAGRFKGKNGYYDDDTDTGRCAIVYLGQPLKSRYIKVKHEYLEPIDEFLPAVKFVLENPEVAKMIPIFVRR